MTQRVRRAERAGSRFRRVVAILSSERERLGPAAESRLILRLAGSMSTLRAKWMAIDDVARDVVRALPRGVAVTPARVAHILEEGS